MKQEVILGESSNDWVVIPILYGDDNHIVAATEEVQKRRRTFGNFNSACEYSKTLRLLEVCDNGSRLVLKTSGQ